MMKGCPMLLGHKETTSGKLVQRVLAIAMFMMLTIASGLVNAAPTVSLSAPSNGAVYSLGSNVTVSASASDTNGIAQVEFYADSTLIGTATSSPYSITWSSPAAGTYVLTAKATSTTGESTTSASRTIRVNQPPTVSITSPAEGALFTAPASVTFTAQASDSDGTISYVYFYRNGSYVGSGTSNGDGTYSFTQTLSSKADYAVTAKAYDNNSATTTSDAVNISINTPPSVSISSSCTTCHEGTTVTLTASTSDADGIEKVEFYAGETLIGTATSSPYTMAWSNAEAGTYSVTAKATDTLGATATSTARSIKINKYPTVSITSPTEGTVYTAGETMTLTATAADTDGTISYVYFYRGTSSLGRATDNGDGTYTLAYTWSSSSSSAEYAITAKATDSNSAITTSDAVNVSVNGLPSVSISSSCTTCHEGTTVTLTATASDTEGIEKVEFYAGETLIGTATSSPYTMAWSDAEAGTYSVTAKATDTLGASKVSSVRTIKINQYPTVSITSPAEGTVYTAGETMTLTATAADTDGTISSVYFYRGTTSLGAGTSNGDGTYTLSYTWSSSSSSAAYAITAQAYDNNSAITTSSAVNVSVNGLPSVSISSPSSGSTHTSSNGVGMTATASDTEGIEKVEFYAGDTLVGTATSSPYTITWASPPAGTYTITAKATDILGASKISSAISIKVNSAVSISMSSPDNAALLMAPATVTLTAAVTDPDSTVQKVDFYRGSTLIGTVTSAPYTYEWTNVAGGTYTLTAKATEADGGVTTSSSVAITVDNLPTVILSVNATTLIGPADITLTSSAVDSDGTITQIEFYNGDTLLSTDTESPYTYTWAEVPIGTYTLTAKATDDMGGVSTSSSVTVEVKANTGPTVSISAPADNATYSLPANITLVASASDADGGTVAQVEFYNGTTLLGTLTQSPYVYSWSDVAQGTYTVTAKATDDMGVSTTSSAITINVSGNAGTTYYIHPDHLNTPRLITDSNNTTVWRWDSDPFGATVPNDTISGTTFTFNPRFPGQYFDKETNLHYNYFRDYDPTLGRYIQSDPIGLNGGLNTYSYVSGNPLNKVDPNGLCECPGGIWDQEVGDFGWSVGAGGYIGSSNVNYVCRAKSSVKVSLRQVCFGGGPYVGAGIGWSVSGTTYGVNDSSQFSGWARHQGQGSFGPTIGSSWQAPLNGDPGGSVSAGPGISGGVAYTACYTVIRKEICPECEK